MRNDILMIGWPTTMRKCNVHVCMIGCSTCGPRFGMLCPHGSRCRPSVQGLAQDLTEVACPVGEDLIVGEEDLIGLAVHHGQGEDHVQPVP